MQERSEIPARKRRQWLRGLIWTAVALSLLLPRDVPSTPKDAAGNASQIPVSLLQIAPADSFSSPAALRDFKRGVEDYLNKQYASALNALPDGREANATAIGDYILLYRAKSHLMMDRDKEALDGFQLLEKQYPNSPLIPDALSGQCQALLKLNDPQPVFAILKSSKMRRDSEALYYQARALELAKENDKAVESYSQLYSAYPKSDFAALAERNLLKLSPAVLKGSRGYGARLQRSENLLKANDARGARLLLLALGRAAAPDPASSQKRSFLLADAEYRLGKTAIALSHLRKVTEANPLIHEKAVRLEGACYRRSNRERDLLALRDKALHLYPRSADTEELCYSVATYFDVNCEADRAWDAYKALHENFPKGRYAERSLWKLALYHYSKKEYREAVSGFWRYLLAYPNPSSASSAIYWMGRCYEMLGSSANARYLYQRAQALANDGYFGQCARKAEAALNGSGNAGNSQIPGIDFAQVVAACDGIRFSEVFLPEPSEAAAGVIERVRQLWSAGLPDMAITELQWGSKRHAQEEKSFAFIASRIHAAEEEHYKCITSLRGIVPDYAHRPMAALHEEIWKLLFPVHHWDILSSQAEKYQLDPALILGIIRQESAFNEQARSSANARGLMQILASTAPKLARQAQIKRFSVKKLYQAETNIALGTNYLATLMRRYGKIELALAAYNAGSTRVDRWLKEFGNVDMPEFVEQIPFSETRGYVKQVLSNQAIYRLLTSSAAPSDR